MDAAPEPIALLLLLPAHTSVPPRPPPLPYVECRLLITLQLRERLSSLLRMTTMLWPPCCREPLPARKRAVRSRICRYTLHDMAADALALLDHLKIGDSR